MIQLLILFVGTFAVTLAVYPALINYLHKLKFGQSIREEGPTAHYKKKGTPTMGGIGFLIIPLFLLLLVDYTLLSQQKFWALYLVFLAFGLTGFIDDYLIVVQKKNDGLRPRYKMLGQLLGALLFVVVYFNQLNATIALPFFHVHLGILYIPFLIIMMMGESNAVNITDGVDGLCASVYMVALIPLAIIAYLKNEYAVLMFIVALFGCLLGYYQYNKNPAKIFMGDTGSLALGGVLAAITIILKVEILLVVFGGVFLMEMLSVMIQVAYYKKTKKRIFLMSPIHHHYELKGMNEKQIVLMFSLWGILFAIGGLLLWLMM